MALNYVISGSNPAARTMSIIIGLILLFLTIVCGYYSIAYRSILFALLTIFVDIAWIIYNYIDHSYIFVIIWCILISFDFRYYERLRSEQEKN